MILQERSAHVNINRTVVVDTLEQMCDLMCGDAEQDNEEHDRCLRCGRKLKNPDARLLGYGTICYNKIRTDSTKKALF